MSKTEGVVGTKENATPMTVADLVAVLAAQSAAQAEANKEMLLEVLREARKPVITEEQLKRIEQDLIDRKEMASTILQKMENEKAFQEICTHMNSNFTTSAVLIQPSNHPPYLLCQHCQKKVWQNKEPRLFNLLVQATGTVGNIFA